jgi:TolB-like protein/Tfp pilus assembly protein PilF
MTNEEEPVTPVQGPDASSAPLAAPARRRVEFRFVSELRRRNVGRVAILYLVGSWLVLQPVNVIFDMLDVPAWANRVVLLLLALGFPAALVFAWVFELTPEGLKPSADVEPRRSITTQTGQRLNRAIIAILTLALAYFVADKFWLSKRVAGESAATQASTAPAVPGPPAAAPSEKSIAVLPFVDMSEKKDQEYFSDGLSEQLIDLIAKVPELRVPARTSSFYFKGKQTTITDIARALGVAHVLEGSVRKSGNTLRITAQLVRADDGFHVWSETYDRQLDDIFKIQDDIAGAVVNALKVSLLGAEPPHAAPAANTEAYTLYLQGRASTRRYTGADNEVAIDYFQRAVQADPGFAPAWADLARAYGAAFALFGTRSGSEDAHKKMSEAAGKALTLDPSLPEGHLAMGAMFRFIDFVPDEAQREYDRAMELAPGNADVLTAASLLAASLGRFDEAARLGQKAVDLDPLAVDPYRALGMAEYAGGRLTEAEAVFRKALELNPTVEAMHYRLALVLLADDKPEAALAESRREPDAARQQLGLALAFDALGRTAEADAARTLAEKNANGWSYQIAQIYAHRADTERAFAWLDRAYAERDSGLPQYLKGDPLLVSLRPDPRYATLLQKLGLPQ